MRLVPQPIKSILEAQGRKQKWLAVTTGRSQHYVWEVVNGLRAPSVGFQRDAAHALGLPESVLFREDWLEVESAS